MENAPLTLEHLDHEVLPVVVGGESGPSAHPLFQERRRVGGSLYPAAVLNVEREVFP